MQTVAFRRRDAAILDASPEICEIAELAVPADGHWIDRMIETCHSDSSLNNDRSFVRNCLSVPMRAAAHGASAFVMFDDLHEAISLDQGRTFFEDIKDIFSRAAIPFIFAGQRRFLFAKTSLDAMRLEPFTFSEAGKYVESLSAKFDVAVNDQARDLIAVQLDGNAGHINSLFASAAANKDDLNSFERVENIYTDEIFGGRIRRYFDAQFNLILPEANIQTNILRLLSEQLTTGGNKMPVSYWKKQSGLAGAAFDLAIEALNRHEIISVGSGAIAIDTANTVLCDYIRSRSRLEIDNESRALTVGETLAKNVKRAPELMARFYRRNSAIGLRELLRAFDGQKISSAAIDYHRFKDDFKGAKNETILESLKADASTITLPQIVYTAHTAAFYPKLNELCDVERSAIALGFADTAEQEETAWIAVEIDSKLEATRDVAEFWCDRLEMVALNCNFKHYKIWLIAPEGFAHDASEILRERNAYGTSRKQVDLLALILNAETTSKSNTSNEYEIVVPMGEDTEMIAAHTIEEIAKRHNFPAKAINQIKTALVEACINASEHSLSPDRKIYQKFAVDADKITITVSNRGLRLADKTANEINPDEGRRGWGLKLIKGLMDEVKLEQTDDGTRITMVKNLNQV